MRAEHAHDGRVVGQTGQGAAGQCAAEGEQQPMCFLRVQLRSPSPRRACVMSSPQWFHAAAAVDHEGVSTFALCCCTTLPFPCMLHQRFSLMSNIADCRMLCRAMIRAGSW